MQKMWKNRDSLLCIGNLKNLSLIRPDFVSFLVAWAENVPIFGHFLAVQIQCCQNVCHMGTKSAGRPFWKGPLYKVCHRSAMGYWSLPKENLSWDLVKNGWYRPRLYQIDLGCGNLGFITFLREYFVLMPICCLPIHFLKSNIRHGRFEY